MDFPIPLHELLVACLGLLPLCLDLYEAFLSPLNICDMRIEPFPQVGVLFEDYLVAAVELGQGVHVRLGLRFCLEQALT